MSELPDRLLRKLAAIEKNDAPFGGVWKEWDSECDELVALGLAEFAHGKPHTLRLTKEGVAALDASSVPRWLD